MINFLKPLTITLAFVWPSKANVALSFYQSHNLSCYISCILFPISEAYTTLLNQKWVERCKSITGTYIFGATFHAIPSHIIRQLTRCFVHVIVAGQLPDDVWWYRMKRCSKNVSSSNRFTPFYSFLLQLDDWEQSFLSLELGLIMVIGRGMH